MVRHEEHFGDDRMSAKNLWPNFKELIEREGLRDRRRDRENKFLKNYLFKLNAQIPRNPMASPGNKPLKPRAFPHHSNPP